jgi:hypothetical protein
MTLVEQVRTVHREVRQPALALPMLTVPACARVLTARFTAAVFEGMKEGDRAALRLATLL